MKTTHPSQKITPFLWFAGNVEKISEFYVSIFESPGNSEHPHSKIQGISYYNKESAIAAGKKEGDVMTATFTLGNLTFTALNGGPRFKINPSISFFVNCETETEVDRFWTKFSNGGKVLIPLAKYHYSDKFGWIEDKYGVSWQIILSKPEGDWRPKIIPSLLFTNEKSGKTKEAIDFYVSLFNNSKIGLVAPNEKPGTEGTTAFADFMLENQWFAAMDSPNKHDFGFNEAVSLVVNCDGQKEIDYFWDKFIENGGKEGRCGWLQDKFGVSWQIVPKNLNQLLHSSDAVHAMMKMKKLNIEELRNA